MGRACKHCKKIGGIEATNQGRTLHRFPLDDAALVEIWKQKLKFHASFTPTKYTLICSDHFRKECFRIIKKRRVLIPGSFPTIFSKRKDRCFYCNATKDEKPGISLRKFPLDNPELLNKWLLAINVIDFVPNKDSLICSDHFKPSCFRYIQNRKSTNLKNEAVPSIFLEGNQEASRRATEESSKETAFKFAKNSEKLDTAPTLEHNHELVIKESISDIENSSEDEAAPISQESGKIANVKDCMNPDWVPNLHLEYLTKSNSLLAKARFERQKKRTFKTIENEG